MFEQYIQEVILLMVYAGVAVVCMIACFYLLFRRGNAFAPDVTPPVRLRRWTAAFFASLAIGHLWYLPTCFLSSSDDVNLCNLIGGLLDSMLTLPLAIVIYLKHDLDILELAKAVGTNRLYLSQHFSKQDMSYNTYINDLRISHFIALYREAVAAQRSVTALQLAQESGFCNYRTFSNAFKRKTGQSVSSWIQGQERPKVE